MVTKRFPSPANWQDFEIFMKDFFNEKYGGGFDRYGRGGQEQFGVDIVGIYKRKNIAIQCKRLDVKLTKKMILNEIGKADTFSPTLDRYIIATTDKRNTKISSDVLKINSSRFDNNLFPVEIMFWETIEEEINGSINIQKKYYDAILSKIDNDYIYKNILSAMEKAFSRPTFATDFNYEGDISHFIKGIADTQQFMNTGRLENRHGDYILGSMSYMDLKYNQDIIDGGKIVKLLQEIRNSIELYKRNNPQSYCIDKKLINDMNSKRKKIFTLLNEIFQRYGKRGVFLSY